MKIPQARFFGSSLQVVGGTSAVAPMWAAWKSLTDGVAGKVLPFSAQVRLCRAMSEWSIQDVQPSAQSRRSALVVCIMGRAPLGLSGQEYKFEHRGRCMV